jgi:HAD superfamily hydrolase (TIGR01509 family)
VVGILFDLDQTLIDSSAAEQLRNSRKWQQVYPLIPKLSPYAGVADLFKMLLERDISFGIVTSAPRPYCTKVIAYHKWAIEKTVCYHDTTRRKPFPDPILKGIELLGIPAERVWSIGDDPKDIAAAHAAGANSIAVAWGCVDRDALVAASPMQLFDKVSELHDFLDRLTIRTDDS